MQQWHVEFDNHVCLECGKTFMNRQSFGNHVNKTHSTTIQAYVLKHFFDGVPPACKCGCGSIVAWHKTEYRFCDFSNGHNRGVVKKRVDERVKETKQSVAEAVKTKLPVAPAPKKQKKERANKKRDVPVDASFHPEIAQAPVADYDGNLHMSILDRLLSATRTLEEHSADAFKFIDDEHPIISREELIRINETHLFPGAPGRQWTNDVLKPAVHRFYRAYVSHHGWFYPAAPHGVAEALKQVRSHSPSEGGVISSLGSAGSAFLKGTFRSFWDVDRGPSKNFWDDGRFDSVLRYRLGLNTSKPYVYVLSDGSVVSCRETFDINIKNIRFGFIVQRNSVSWFKPAAAYDIYKHFLENNASPVVWDPSCGFGARLLGFAAAYPYGTYIGTDPAEQTFRDLSILREEIAKVNHRLAVELLMQGSEVGLASIGNNCVDFVFTSPPYFDKEKYFDEPSQCWNKFNNIDSWVKNYLIPTFNEAFRVLKPRRKMVINIDQKTAEYVVSAAKAAGFEQLDSLKLSIGRDHFVKHSQGDKVEKQKYEPILVFQK
jgi:hypothetical protein